MLARHAVLLTPLASPHPKALLSRQPPPPISPLAATLMNLLASAANKRLTVELSPLDATLTKYRGDILRPKAFLFLQLFALFNSSQRFSVFVAARSSIFRTLFHVRYAVTPVFVALAKTAGVYTNNSHSGTRHSPVATILKFFHWPELANRHGRIPSTCFLFNFQLSTVNFQYNRCASIRGRNEFPPALRGDKNRFRAALLGRQHQRNLRAPLLLRRVRLSRQLSPRKAEFPHRTDRHAYRNFRRHGLVPRDLRRRRRRSPRLPPRSLARLPDSRCGLFSARFARCSVAGSGEGCDSAGDFCGLHSGLARSGRFARKALRRRDHRSRVKGKRALHRLLHLLHYGQHRRRFRPLRRVLGSSSSRRRERISRCGSQRLRHVLRGSPLLPRAQARQRRPHAQHCRNAAEFPDRFVQPKIHAVSADFYRLLDRFLAAVHFPPRLHPRLYQRRCRRRVDPHHRRPRGHLFHAVDQLPDSQHPRFRCSDSGNSRFIALLARHRLPTYDSWRGSFHPCPRTGRNDSSPALLRIHFAPRAPGTAGDLHGLRVFADRYRLAHRRLVRWPHHAPVRRSGAPASACVVGDFGGWPADRSAAVDLRPHRQTIRAGGSWVNRINLENRRRFFLN